jgi:hypothetical protein
MNIYLSVLERSLTESRQNNNDENENEFIKKICTVHALKFVYHLDVRSPL